MVTEGEVDVRLMKPYTAKNTTSRTPANHSSKVHAAVLRPCRLRHRRKLL